MAACPVITFLAVALALAAQAPPPAPVIDNDQVRVASITVLPGERSVSRQGTMNRLLIYPDPGSEQVTGGNGRAETRTVRSGDIRWSPAAEDIAANTGGAPLRVVQVDLKRPGRPVEFGALDPVRLAPRSYRVLLENPQVRVLRARIDAHGSVPFHEHALNRVVVYLTDAHLRITDERGKAAEGTGKAWDVRWSGPGRHSETNLAASAFEVVVVEVK